MTISISNFFWDSCVFIRYLENNAGSDFINDISQFIADAQSGSARIYYSTLAMAEIKPSHLTLRGYGNFNDFLEDFESAFHAISPTPDVMAQAGSIRDFKYPNPNGGSDRILGTADAIHLTTAIYVRDVLGIEDLVFHTLDAGKGKNWEGKCVPLLGYEKWTVGVPKNPYVKKICDLPRQKPAHPNPELFSR
ncbi:type II toxin-antitoxin system VapC family toxin [Roseibium sp.]|uniref:type II toxin-antitoxin system VapC family toxin n=1 Tax=Roseibium sp. TaxID=1936156 RepID=UPI003BAEFA68